MAIMDPVDRPISDEHRADVDRARVALLDPSMAHIVDMVLEADGTEYLASSAEGSVRFTAGAAGSGWDISVVAVEGENPVAHQAAGHLAPLDAERADPAPTRDQNSYPMAYEQVVQLFDSPAAPDLVAIHTGAHNWEDQGGHRGEHGSIGVVQARAPFVIAGAGVRQEGMVASACSVVDIAPTVLALLGAEPTTGVARNGSRRDDAYLARQDGDVLDEVLDGSAPEHVVGFLIDGTNANVLHDMVARGEAPNIARLMEMGSTFGHGAISALPTVTLANHTSILTGCFPGHHGILHNAWYDRRRGEQIITNSPAHWMTSMQHLSPEVESLYSAVKRHFPGSLAVSINEPCDAGADYSIFELFRTGAEIPTAPPTAELPDATERFVRPSKDYKTASKIDHTSVDQACGIWSGHYRGTEWPVPKFTWVNFTLTDAAFHEGGPYSDIAAASVHDTDARIGRVLEAVEASGAWDRTAFFVTADHGMQESDPSCTGNWADALDESGVDYRDEGYSFIYVNP
ncbi:MAG: alkaline phosphatase family protein [Acidimicrobiia bacterium]|nr:alkaline phosphatase family protein [Acidimicrobiia bacterium]